MYFIYFTYFYYLYLFSIYFEKYAKKLTILNLYRFFLKWVFTVINTLLVRYINLFLNSFSLDILLLPSILCVGVYARPWVSRSRLLRDGRVVVDVIWESTELRLRAATRDMWKRLVLKEEGEKKEAGREGRKSTIERTSEYAYRGKSEMRWRVICVDVILPCVWASSISRAVFRTFSSLRNCVPASLLG